MKRLVLNAVIKICGKAILLTVLVGIVIGIIGYVNRWDTSLPYSNALFVAGCLLIIAGTASRLGAGQEWESFQRLSAESFRSMSVGERASFIVEASSPVSLAILGLLSGVLLMLISLLVMKVF